MRAYATTAALLFALGAGPALADGVVQKLITASDKQKLANYGDTRKQALAEAKGGAPADTAVLDTVVTKPFQSFSGLDLTGTWQCRTIKLGGLGTLVVYGWFKCRITDDGSGWKLDKLTGSQRTTGRFYDDGDKRLIYLGSYFSAYDKAKPYGGDPQTDQVGYAFRTGKAEWHIEFPAPAFESKLDILEFKR